MVVVCVVVTVVCGCDWCVVVTVVCMVVTVVCGCDCGVYGCDCGCDCGV